MPAGAFEGMDWTPSLNARLRKLAKRHKFQWNVISEAMVARHLKKIRKQGVRQPSNEALSELLSPEACRVQFASMWQSSPRRLNETGASNLKFATHASKVDEEVNQPHEGPLIPLAFNSQRDMECEPSTHIQKSSRELLAEFEAEFKTHKAQMKEKERAVFDRLALSLGISEDEIRAERRKKAESDDVAEDERLFLEHYKRLSGRSALQLAAAAERLEEEQRSESSTEARLYTSGLAQARKEEEAAAFAALGLDFASPSTTARTAGAADLSRKNDAATLSIASPSLLSVENAHCLDEMLRDVILSPPRSPRSNSDSGERSELSEVLNTLAIAAAQRPERNSPETTAVDSCATHKSCIDATPHASKGATAETVAAAAVAAAAADLETMVGHMGLSGTRQEERGRIVARVERGLRAQLNGSAGVDRSLADRLSRSAAEQGPQTFDASPPKPPSGLRHHARSAPVDSRDDTLASASCARRTRTRNDANDVSDDSGEEDFASLRGRMKSRSASARAKS
jgi:hypothetical protein